MAALEVTREQVLAFRRQVSALEHRLPAGADSLREAAWAGLQDSMPRAAVLSIHARVEGTDSAAWEHEALVQIWGPRFSAYVTAAVDLSIFTLGRMPTDKASMKRAEDAAASLARVLDGKRMRYGDAGTALGVHGNSFRYGTVTGTILMRWEGARQPVVWIVPRPSMSVDDARLELARRYLHVFGPTTAESFAKWAGIALRAGIDAFAGLGSELIEVATPIGTGRLLASDESAVRAEHAPAPQARLLPSGDTFFLLWGRDRELLVPDARHRGELWTTRVWPGALLVNGEVAGVWRRANERVAIDAWRPLASVERDAVEAEAMSLPLAGLTRPISVSWSSS
jgi:hypothetical protein